MSNIETEQFWKEMPNVIGLNTFGMKSLNFLRTRQNSESMYAYYVLFMQNMVKKLEFLRWNRTHG